jgi:hypothetical protein
MGISSQSTVFGSQKKRPIITLPEAAPDYSAAADGIWKRQALLTPPPMFFVSVASKGLRVCVSGSESTLTGLP